MNRQDEIFKQVYLKTFILKEDKQIQSDNVDEIYNKRKNQQNMGQDFNGDPIDDLTKENTVTIEEDKLENNSEIDDKKDAFKDPSKKERDVEINVQTEGGDDVENNGQDEENFEDDGNDGNDGWDENIVENMSSLLGELENFIYELNNCVRGSFTGCKTKEQLKEYMKGLAEQLNEYAEDL